MWVQYKLGFSRYQPYVRKQKKYIMKATQVAYLLDEFRLYQSKHPASFTPYGDACFRNLNIF
jgi:hypothetical protein